MAIQINWFTSNWKYRLIALVLAVFAWYMVTGRDKVDTWVTIPIEFRNLPKDLVATKGLDASVEVRLRGTRVSLNALKDTTPVYALDLSDIKVGENLIALDPANLKLVGALEVVAFRPSRIGLSVDQVLEKVVPVEIDMETDLSQDFKAVSTAIEPAVVSVRGPQGIVRDMTSMRASPIVVGDITQPGRVTVNVPLDAPEEVEVIPPQVQVTIAVAPVVEEIWVKVPVVARAAGGVEFFLEDKDIRLHLDVPATTLRETEWKNRLAVELVVPSDLPAGRYKLRPNILLPKWTTLIESRPETVTVEITSAKGQQTTKDSQ